MLGQRPTPAAPRLVCRSCLTATSTTDRYCRQCGADASLAVVLPAYGNGYDASRPMSRSPFLSLPVLVGAGLLTICLAIAVTLAVLNFQRARTWEDRSNAWEARAIAAEERGEALDVQLNDVQSQLVLTRIGLDNANADRLSLQSRVDELAGEKATAEDERNVAQSERDYANYIAGLAGRAANDGNQCLIDVGNAVSAIASYASISYIDSLIVRVEVSCGQFDASYQNFAAAVY